MGDDEIVALYWQRDQEAIRQTEGKYGGYLNKIAYHVLADWEDSRESVNDTYFKAWGSMPPHRPQVLRTYLGKIAREVAIDLFRRRHRAKRRASEYALSLSELEECVSGGDTTREGVELRLLAQAVADYLRTLSPPVRSAFVGRYYFMDSLGEVAAYCGMSQSGAKSALFRARQGLRSYLEREGFEV